MKLLADIKELLADVVSFVREDWNPFAYGWAALVAATLVVLAYPLGGYSRWVIPLFRNGMSWWAMPVFFYCVYMLVAIPNLLIRKEHAPLRRPAFYLKPAFFIFLMSFTMGYRLYNDFFRSLSLNPTDRYYLTWLWLYFDGIVLVMLPLAIYKYIFDRRIEGLYGLCRRSRHVPVYLTALLFILPFVAAASFLPDFQAYYPRFRPDYCEGAFGWPMWAVTALFETCYGLDFITTEVFFRGAMVIGMTAILGPRAVLPMCVYYCTVHFGKPCLESVSAIFGGYLLGILAYKTKHIWGGVCAHLGIAFMMEIMGLLHLFAGA
ncbi:MAG: hypothetical protein IJV55_03390 [Paludibacteraceae bacterium]|nr:hypothetical protein [Paludibacteraceae bacterium]